jgi:hypothetical protein
MGNIFMKHIIEGKGKERKGKEEEDNDGIERWEGQEGRNISLPSPPRFRD